MKRFLNILYVMDSAADQTSALAGAVTLAENNGARLTIMDVLPPVAAAYHAGDMESRARILKSLITPYRRRLTLQTEVLTGTLFLEVIRAVLGKGHDLVIKAAENPDFMTRLFGSDDMHLLRKCPCPVWLMKMPEKTNYSRILAAVDLDPLKPTAVRQALNETILELAASLSITDVAALDIAHAWEAFTETTMRSRSDLPGAGIADYVEKERALYEKHLFGLGAVLEETIGRDDYHHLSPRFHLVKGSAKKMIPELSGSLGADLVVMGTVARTGIAGLIIGNTAEAVLNQLSCSVLAVKPPGFISPVKP